MKWSYKTVHFELKKEGLLGSGFLDESEIEQELNEFGLAGWELVSVLEVQDGIIVFFKQPLNLDHSGPPEHYGDIVKHNTDENQIEQFEDLAVEDSTTAQDVEQSPEQLESSADHEEDETAERSESPIGAIKIE